MNNFFLGSRTSMVHQNTSLSSISYPRVMMIPHTYLILASRTQTLHFSQHVIFPCPKVPFIIGCHNIKKRNWTMVPTPRYLLYMHMVKIHQQYLEHLTDWWCSGAGNNRIDIKWPKMHMLQKYLRCYRTHTRYAESQMKYLGINLFHNKGFGLYHCFR